AGGPPGLAGEKAEPRPAAGAAGAVEPSSSALLMQWQDSVVAIWTPTAHATGFVVSAGLIATNQRVVGTATTVEVQLSPSLKVAGKVLTADAAKDVALISVAADVLASIHPGPPPWGAKR